MSEQQRSPDHKNGTKEDSNSTTQLTMVSSHCLINSVKEKKKNLSFTTSRASKKPERVTNNHWIKNHGRFNSLEFFILMNTLINVKAGTNLENFKRKFSIQLILRFFIKLCLWYLYWLA